MHPLWGVTAPLRHAAHHIGQAHNIVGTIIVSPVELPFTTAKSHSQLYPMTNMLPHMMCHKQAGHTCQDEGHGRAAFQLC